MSENSNLVPEPQDSVYQSVERALGGDEKAARQVMANPNLAGSVTGGSLKQDETDGAGHECGCGDHAGSCGCQDDKADAENAAENAIPLKAVDDIGRATARDVREAMHQVIDPELGIDVIDLGLVYGIEIDELGRAIITMTLTTPACPLTDLIEDETASILAGLVEEFRIDWTWTPPWSVDKITPEGRDQLAALGFNFNNLPTYGA
ncbi:metal-sulfur cluster assembly factor [Bifidobacterium simiarum]|uniref:MIP18 family-like domain-containing protein n=1 Tax=Bifidobacterium simiarum TaxID=2045441 RepID=A0A2M9HCI5_9BIFI|nr:metal-sulfur cluster assembly factor [Bifidobacterium simiarum]MBT1166202.1 metal-sulfur cluster assembly factor [Bifidobacterium simiarum]PJM74525.1 hypothetical protein CSQ87_09565 [Bifidobacterium simiarum]